MRKALYTIALAMVGLLTKAETLKSPNGAMQLNVEVKNGTAVYRLDYKNRPVIKESHLGFELKDGRHLKDGFAITNTATSSFDETWEPVWGETKTIRNHYNELRASFVEGDRDHRRLDVVFRVFDDGIGFRYEFPRQPKLDQVQMKIVLPRLDRCTDT